MNDTDWLDISPPKKRRKKAIKVEPGAKLPFENKRAHAMIKKLSGNSRMWVCDGEYVYFRPTRVVEGVKTVVANPTTMARHNRFLSEGQYTHIETQDDVEVYRVNEGSAFARKGFYLGEMKDSDVRRAVALAACARDWPLYVDCLEELAGRIKGRYDPGMAKQIYDDQLSYIATLISMRGGPTAGECAAGLSNVRSRRGMNSGKVIMLPQGRAA